jgi:LuxR family maltose regulon positive regulatory protein
VELLRQPHRVYRQMKLYLLDALCKRRAGSPNAAHRCLRKALKLAQTGRYVRSFLDEGEEVVQMLRETYQGMFGGAEPRSPTERAFIEEVLAASGTDLGLVRVSRTPAHPQALSEREKEILALLANGVANREIAERLFVSENTVKFHLKNIYSKLSVGTRLQAINMARSLGWVT